MQDGTYNQDRQPVTHASGYQVGLWTETTKPESLESVIEEITRTWSGEWGVWTADSGRIFVEPCVWLPELPVARAIGRRYNQICVWCWATMKEIMIDEE